MPILLELLGQSTSIIGELPEIMQRFLVLFDSVSEAWKLPVMMLSVVSLIILKNAAIYAGSIAANNLNRRLAADLRLEGLRILLDVDLAYYAKTKVGDLINHLNVEVSRTTIAIRTLARLVISIITILVFISFLVALSWQLTLISTTALALVALINQTAVKKAKAYGAELSQYSRRYSARIVEILSGIRLVKATASEASEYKTISRLIADREVSEYRSQLLFAGITPINEVCSIIALIAVAWLGRVVMADELEAFSSILLGYLIMLFRMLPAIGQLNATRSKLANVSPSVAVMGEFLRRDDKPFMGNGTLPYRALQSGIRFKNITFRYPGHDKQVLKGVDLSLERGTTLALVGASGAGKSTLADLLPRFYDPTSGSIELDGHNLKDFEIGSFRKRLGIVSQDTFLFNTTVRENLIYGRPEATDADIQDAIQRANAHEFIDALPDGLETLIGDRGVLLSGGQRQRLAIARALLQDPDILILDEATSALDTISERLVQKAIDELSRDRTTLVIAHRLSTVQNADQIAVMDQGVVVETGNHHDLLAQGGYYAQLCAIQFSAQVDDDGRAPEYAEKEANVAQASYEMRSHLNNVIGILDLLTDESLVRDSAEREGLAASAQHMTLTMLKSVEALEKLSRETIHHQSQSSERGRRSSQPMSLSADAAQNAIKEPASMR
ncbi:MAG: ABC transporter ATP-binding protein [Cyanobacteria bacterium P01_D01_bin.105]